MDSGLRRINVRARFNFAQIEPGKYDDAAKLFKETVAPANLSAPGYAGSVYALDETNNRAIAIVLWETESDMEAFPGLVQENPSLAAGIFSMP